jgi:flavodoxin
MLCSYIAFFAVKSNSMKKLLLVFHSKTGGTYQMVQAAAKGAQSEPDVGVNLIHAGEAGSDELLGSDGYIFATPENLAMMSGMMKDFFDRTYYTVLDRIVGRPYATLICAGSDGENAARQIQRIATGWRLKALPNRSSSAPTRKHLRPSSRRRKLVNMISSAAKKSAPPVPPG